jgi:hypothetical protein
MPPLPKPRGDHPVNTTPSRRKLSRVAQAPANPTCEAPPQQQPQWETQRQVTDRVPRVHMPPPMYGNMGFVPDSLDPSALRDQMNAGTNYQLLQPMWLEQAQGSHPPQAYIHEQPQQAQAQQDQQQAVLNFLQCALVDGYAPYVGMGPVGGVTNEEFHGWPPDVLTTIQELSAGW